MKMTLNFIQIPKGRVIEVAPPFRTTINNQSEMEFWKKKASFSDAYVSVYSFSIPNNYSTALVDKVFWDVDKDSGKAMRLLNDYYSEYERMFIATGNNFHLYVAIEPIKEIKYKKASLRTHISTVERELGIVNDPATKGNLAQMGRLPNSVNTKNSHLCMFFDPIGWETSREPVLLRGKRLKIELIEEEPLDLQKIKGAGKIVNEIGDQLDFDSDDLLMELLKNFPVPSEGGHFSRLTVLRKLRWMGVPPTVAKRFMYEWLSKEKIKAMEREKQVERVYAFKI